MNLSFRFTAPPTNHIMKVKVVVLTIPSRFISFANRTSHTSAVCVCDRVLCAFQLLQNESKPKQFNTLSEMYLWRFGFPFNSSTFKNRMYDRLVVFCFWQKVVREQIAHATSILICNETLFVRPQSAVRRLWPKKNNATVDMIYNEIESVAIKSVRTRTFFWHGPNDATHLSRVAGI